MTLSELRRTSVVGQGVLGREISRNGHRGEIMDNTGWVGGGGILDNTGGVKKKTFCT